MAMEWLADKAIMLGAIALVAQAVVFSALPIFF
jgi:hypothetical protein